MSRIRGFTLIELLIVVAVISVIAAIALPAYRGYIETAKMSKVNSAYENAVRVTREEFVKDTARISMGLPSTLPRTEEEWVAVFDPAGKATAPEGGPAYVAGTTSNGNNGNGNGNGNNGNNGNGGGNNGNQGNRGSGTGVIYVIFDDQQVEVDIRRPRYISLEAFSAKIKRDSIVVEEG